MGGCNDVVCFWRNLFVFGRRGLATLLLFLYVTEEAGRKCVRVYAMAASGRMQYDYKQTNKLTITISSLVITEVSLDDLQGPIS